jgi:hypothetical protein
MTANLVRQRGASIRLLVQTIESGLIDTSGKTVDQIIQEATQLLKEFAHSEPSEVHMGTSHLEDLLQQASKFIEQDALYFACLFYATWLEHWVNRLFFRLAERRDMLTTDIVNMLREVRLEGKMTWLPQLFGLEPIDKVHRVRIASLMSRRNEFTHFKWKVYNLDSGVEYEQGRSLADLMEQFRATTIPYLLDYEDRHLDGGMRESLLQRVSSFRFIAPESE